MILGLKRRIISKFLQTAKLKLTEKKNIQEIQRCLEDGISFCPDWVKTPRKGKVLMFNFKHDTSQYNFFESVTSNGEVCKYGDHIFFYEAPNVLTEAVLTDIHEHAENYGKNQAMEYNKYYNGEEHVDIPKNENVVVKLCAQEIAEPFLATDLRRIMCGRFITNITKLFNKNVSSINYLRDWMDMMITQLYRMQGLWGMEEDKRIDLTDAFGNIKYQYTWEETMTQLVAFMKSVEQGDQKALETWQKCRNVCVGDHEKMYQKLGIKFDGTCAQSHYTEQTNQIISMAKEKNLLGFRKNIGLYRIIEPGTVFGLYYYIQSCDPRDFASIYDIFNKYSPDRLICVSELGFKCPYNLESIAKSFKPDWPGRIEIARIGLPIVFLKNSRSTSDVLDELMISKTVIMMKHKLGEDCESLSDVSDKLSISRFAMQNFKRRRNNNFMWSLRDEKIQKAFNGRDGLTLQYTHARLCRLITLYSDDYSFESVDFNLLSEDCAIRLVQHLARYHEVLIQCYMELESIHLVNYLNTLLKLERLAYKELLVYNQPKKIRDARLTLFKCTRQVLANGMNILCIQPLGKI